jgi:hypothetical protein
MIAHVTRSSYASIDLLQAITTIVTPDTLLMSTNRRP